MLSRSLLSDRKDFCKGSMQDPRGRGEGGSVGGGGSRAGPGRGGVGWLFVRCGGKDVPC